MIQKLVNTNQPVEVQETDFSIDVLGRYICNSFDEAVNNGGRPFDAIVIGAGMFGAYCAEKIYRRGNMRVLVLDAGAFLVSEHVQNLARIGLNSAGAVKVSSNAQDPGTRERVWGNPWHSSTPFPGLAYCLGGRSLYWGGWSPRLTDEDFKNWPQEIVNYLEGPNAVYPIVEEEIGTSQTTDYISGKLFQELMKKFNDAVSQGVPGVYGIEEAPLAVQGNPPASGLFSFDKYSSAPILVDAIREDAITSPDNERRLFYVPRAQVVKLYTNDDQVNTIEVRVNGQTRFLNVAPHCSVVLANGTIESTRLAMESFPTALMGKNLMAHLRSNTVVRIHRSAFPSLPIKLETAALLVRGSTSKARFHLQVTAAAVDGSNSEAVMFRMIPDIELLDQTLSSQTADWIVITLRGIGEMHGDKNATEDNTSTSWMNLSPYAKDQFGFARAWVNLVKTQDDAELWKTMDDAALELAQKLAGNDPSKIQYFYNKDGSLNAPGAMWHNDPPPPSMSNDRDNPNNKVRDGLGTTHHEAGTLWMGTDKNTSVTDLDGKFHHIKNAYVAGPAVFPALGSANPSLTALALSRKTASAVARELKPVKEPDYIPLLDEVFDTTWEMIGAGKFRRFGNIIESDGGTGLLVYKKEKFKNFRLKLDWRVMDVTDNSGIYVRVPELDKNDPQWLQKANSGWEIQIDERGFDSDSNTENNPLKKTGAVYDVSPAIADASKPVCEWNTYEIEVNDHDVMVLLNGVKVSEVNNDTLRPSEGYIGLQNHHPGSRVQFGNIRVRQLN